MMKLICKCITVSLIEEEARLPCSHIDHSGDTFSNPSVLQPEGEYTFQDFLNQYVLASDSANSAASLVELTVELWCSICTSVAIELASYIIISVWLEFQKKDMQSTNNDFRTVKVKWLPFG